MPQFNGKQGAPPHRGMANLRCPRNGKRTNFARNSVPSSKPLDALPKQTRLGRRWNCPPARIPANKEEARPQGELP
jgi:hypothetical protein